MKLHKKSIPTKIKDKTINKLFLNQFTVVTSKKR